MVQAYHIITFETAFTSIEFMHENIYHFDNKATVVFSNSIEPKDLAVRFGANANKISHVKTASTKDDPGYQSIVTAKFEKVDKTDFDVFADGIVLDESNTCAVIYTADCPSVTLYEKVSNRLVLAHSGRPAMTPNNKEGEPITNIITLAFKKITEGVQNPKVSAHITGYICAEHFEHIGKEAELLIRPFDQFGKIAFLNRERGQLDLPAIIEHQLSKLGVPKDSIKSESICTFESPELESYRRDRSSKRNLTVAILH